MAADVGLVTANGVTDASATTMADTATSRFENPPAAAREGRVRMA